MTMAKILTILLFIIAGTATAMNLNLARPWGDVCSPPQTPYLSFYSHQSEDMMFDRGRKIRITCQAGLRSLGLSWSLHRNRVEKPFLTGEAEALPANKFQMELPTKGLLPGFYDLRVTLDTGLVKKDRDKLKKRPVTGICTFGWKVSKMPIRDTRPADFKQFWAKAKNEIDAIPLDARNETPMETFTAEQIDAYNLKSACLPGDYDPNGHVCEEVESCKVSFAGPDGGRVYGWLAKPKGEGPFPVMLVLPGAGFAARSRPLEHARHGYLALDIQIHGQDVNIKGKYPKLPGYFDNFVYEPANKYYFYNVHKRVIQAVNYLVSRPDADDSRIVAVGGSQGGRLGIVIAALDPRITAVVSTIANSPNYPHLNWVSHCNGFKDPGDRPWTIKYERGPLSDGMDLTGAPPAVESIAAKCFSYYDPMNYAPDIKCPVLMLGGLIDPVSPPYSVWAVFNRLQTKSKEIVPVPGHGHDWSAAFDRYAWKWLKKVQ